MTDAATLRPNPARAPVDWPAPARSGADVDPLAHVLSVAYRGATVVCSRNDGLIDVDDPELAGTGLFHAETRILSRYVLRLGDRPPSGAGTTDADGATWTAHLLVARDGGTADGPALPQDAIAIRVERIVGSGLIERLTVTNHSMVPLDTRLDLDVAADFADVLDLGREWRQSGRAQADWSAAASQLTIRYEATAGDRGPVLRGLRLGVRSSDSPPAHATLDDGAHRLTFEISLPPRGTWSAELSFEPLERGRLAIEDEPAAADPQVPQPARTVPHLRVEGADGLVGPAVEQAARDLVALRDADLERFVDPRHGPAWVTGAGFPRFTGFFGRDSLTAAYQAAMLGPEFLRGALEIASRTQGRRDDPWSEEQPGRMVHEMRRGPLAELGVTPHARYYGTHTTAAMFLIALSELWHWTGDLAVLERHRHAAVRAIEWAERLGDLDGDGFLEYTRRSPGGLKNQAWKDSDEAIRDADGRNVSNPVATVEEQAFHYLALERMAEIHVALGDEPAAEACLARSEDLRRRFDAAFSTDDGFLALGLGPDKQPIRSIASNAGHALATGILEPERARAVADRLLAPDLFTAWGVRTLSSAHPSYNPFAYHLGAVWPVENASFALGCKRYGLDDHAERLTDAIFRAAGHHHRLRLPEAIAGIDIDASPTPVAYPAANRPQAWSSSALVQAVQIMLGLYPFAPARVLAVVRPRLPAWLPRLSVSGLRVGDAVVNLAFERASDGSTDWSVSRADGDLHVLGAGPPADAGGDRAVGERLATWAIDHVPGRTARAMRIALGRERRPAGGSGADDDEPESREDGDHP